MNRENSRTHLNASRPSPRTPLTQGRILLDPELTERLGLTTGDLEALLAFEGEGAPVMSLYLSVDPAHRTKYQSRLHLKDLVKSSNMEPGEVLDDIARAADYLQNEYDWQAEGLAIFSCSPKRFWQVVRLPLSIQDKGAVADRPYVRPLLGFLSGQTRYGFVLVDREVSRVYGVYLGEMRELGEKRRDVPKHHKQTEATPKVQRQAEEAAMQNLRLAAEEAVALLEKFCAQQILLAGQSESVSTLKEYLPKAWQARVVGELTLDTNAGASHVKAKALETIAHIESDRQSGLVESLENVTHKRGATGALGLTDTLMVLMEGKVMTLVVAEDYAAKGYQCENCGYLAANEIEPCPICGHHMRLVGHAVDLAIRKAMESHAQVETIRAPGAAGRLLEDGGIGAMLRF